MTPAEELLAAASKLRTAVFRGAMTATPAVAALVRAREPLAKWLEETAAEVRTAEGTEYALHPDGGVFGSWDAALAVARAINSVPESIVPREPSPRQECANCWREIENRCAPTMNGPGPDNWVHTPGGFQQCFPHRPNSPRAEPVRKP